MLRNLVFIDLETTGLDPQRNQTIEFAAVPIMTDGPLIYASRDDAFHCYIDHPQLTFEPQALLKFGNRIDSRIKGVPIETPASFRGEFGQWIRDCFGSEKMTLGGKNVGNFDLQFLQRIYEPIDHQISHRIVDIGNLFHGLDMDTPKIPDLSECLRIAKAQGFSSNYDVTHTAIDDAMVCAELYLWLYNRN